MSILSRAFRIVRSVANSPQGRRAIRESTNKVTGRSRNQDREQRSGRKAGPVPAGHANQSGAPVLSANDQAIEYDVKRWGMPDFEHSPADDGDADPGEVCWTWVPYEDDPNQGKDRPVIVLARQGKNVVFAQMTSKDHDRGRPGEPDHLGRVWFDIGTGDWDNKGRDSEVRIDRLLLAHEDSIRREGAVLDKTRFTQLIRAIMSQHA